MGDEKENMIPQNIKDRIDAALVSSWAVKGVNIIPMMAEAMEKGAEIALESQWISVKDRLPDTLPDKHYSANVFTWCDGQLMVMSLAWLPDDNGGYGYVWGNNYGNIDGESEADDDYNPTHWMPLPEKPNE